MLIKSSFYHTEIMSSFVETNNQLLYYGSADWNMKEVVTAGTGDVTVLFKIIMKYATTQIRMHARTHNYRTVFVTKTYFPHYLHDYTLLSQQNLDSIHKAHFPAT